MLPIPNNPDPELVRRTRQGERDAFLELVRRHAPAVRAIIEARIPGSEKIDAEMVSAFVRIHRTLFVVRDLTWFHLFAVRTTQAHLDGRRLSPDDPGPDAPPWLKRLTLGQREALFFAERAERIVPFPAIEYLGIQRQAYEARWERGQRLRDEQPAGTGLLGAEPLPDMPERTARAIDQALGPQKGTNADKKRRRPLPLPMAFLLAVGVAAMLVATLFRPPKTTGASTKTIAIGAHDVPGGRLSLDDGTRASFESADRSELRLTAGTLQLRTTKPEQVEIKLDGSTFRPGVGEFRIDASDDEFVIHPQSGSGTLRDSGGSEAKVDTPLRIRRSR